LWSPGLGTASAGDGGDHKGPNVPDPECTHLTHTA
jgi:hypothetical protein